MVVFYFFEFSKINNNLFSQKNKIKKFNPKGILIANIQVHQRGYLDPSVRYVYVNPILIRAPYDGFMVTGAVTLTSQSHGVLDFLFITGVCCLLSEAELGRLRRLLKLISNHEMNEQKKKFIYIRNHDTVFMYDSKTDAMSS